MLYRNTVAGFVALAVMVVSGCQTTEQYQAAVDQGLDARLSRFNGSTMAAFSAQTGLLPSDAYSTASGRVFVIDGPPITMTLPATHVTPAVTRSSVCRLQVSTVRMGETNTADDWRIMSTSRTGPCNNLL